MKESISVGEGKTTRRCSKIWERNVRPPDELRQLSHALTLTLVLGPFHVPAPDPIAARVAC